MLVSVYLLILNFHLLPVKLQMKARPKLPPVQMRLVQSLNYNSFGAKRFYYNQGNEFISIPDRPVLEGN